MAEHVKAQVFDYLSDSLEPAEKAAFEAHLATCAECTAEVEQKRKFLAALQTALTAPSPLSDLELLNKVRAEHARRMAARRQGVGAWLRENWGKLALGLVAAAFCVVVADVVVENRPGTHAAPRDEHNYHPDGGDAGAR